jgi:replicative DNA helicase
MTSYLKKHKLPGHGDWETWLSLLQEGMLRDGTKEALGRLLSADISGHDAEFFAEHVIEDLQKAAAQVVRARLNENPALEPKTLITLAERVSTIRSGSLQGLARLSDIDIWSQQPREEEYISTGYPTLNRLIGGWGKEEWILFADSGVGKSILLQNFAVNAAVRGKNVIHITLELGLRAQIHRYYRQIARSTAR